MRRLYEKKESPHEEDKGHGIWPPFSACAYAKKELRRIGRSRDASSNDGYSPRKASTRISSLITKLGMDRE